MWQGAGKPESIIKETENDLAPLLKSTLPRAVPLSFSRCLCVWELFPHVCATFDMTWNPDALENKTIIPVNVKFSFSASHFSKLHELKPTVTAVKVLVSLVIPHFWHWQDLISGYLWLEDNGRPWSCLTLRCNQARTEHIAVFLPRWLSFIWDSLTIGANRFAFKAIMDYVKAFALYSWKSAHSINGEL